MSQISSLEEVVHNLSAFLNGLDEEGEQKFELSHSVVIVCPDCGKNVAYRNRCPKCGGESWMPAGHAGGIFERMKTHRWRELLEAAEEDELVEQIHLSSAEQASTTQ